MWFLIKKNEFLIICTLFLLKLSFLHENDIFSFSVPFFQIPYFFLAKMVIFRKIAIFWRKFNFEGSKEIIFRMGHVTVGLHMLP